MNTQQQLWGVALPLVVALVAYVRAELAHRTAATTAAATAAPAPIVNVHPAAGPAPQLVPDPADVLAAAPSADLWAQLEHRGWTLASQADGPQAAAGFLP